MHFICIVLTMGEEKRKYRHQNRSRQGLACKCIVVNTLKAGAKHVPVLSASNFEVDARFGA